MNEQEIIQFLKNNLKIEIGTRPHGDHYQGITGYDIKVTLILKEEKISDFTTSISIIKTNFLRM